MDKQKQILEIAEVIAKYISSRDFEVKFITNPNSKAFPFSHTAGVAEDLYNAGYRKIPEGAVVLTEKEYKRYERIEKIIKLAKMEKANGYEVKNGKLYYFSNMLDGCEIEFKDLQEICDMANHYNEEFWGLEQRLTFWQAKAEETRKETVEKIYKGLCKKWGKMKNCILVGNESEDLKDLIVEICKEITEGKV